MSLNIATPDGSAPSLAEILASRENAPREPRVVRRVRTTRASEANHPRKADISHLLTVRRTRERQAAQPRETPLQDVASAAAAEDSPNAEARTVFPEAVAQQGRPVRTIVTETPSETAAATHGEPVDLGEENTALMGVFIDLLKRSVEIRNHHAEAVAHELALRAELARLDAQLANTQLQLSARSFVSSLRAMPAAPEEQAATQVDEPAAAESRLDDILMWLREKAE